MKFTRFLLMAMACMALTITACGGDDEINVNNGGGNGQEEPTPDPDPTPTPDPDPTPTPDPDPTPTPDPGTTPIIDPNGPAEYEGVFSWLSNDYIFDNIDLCVVEFWGTGAWLDMDGEPINADNYVFYFQDSTNGYQLMFEIQAEVGAGFCGEFVSNETLEAGSIVDAVTSEDGIYGCWFIQYDLETGDGLLPYAPLFGGEATITAMEEEGWYSFEIEIGDLADEPDTHYLTCLYEGPVYDAAELGSAKKDAKKGAKKILNAKIERVRK